MRPMCQDHTHTTALMIALLTLTGLMHVVLGQPTPRNTENLARQLSGAAGDENKTVPFSSWSYTSDTLQYGLAFIIVLVAAHPLGLLFPKFCKLPLITGYLFIGIIAGPFVANLLTEPLVNMLSSYVSALALSFISFQAGQEIYWPELRPQLKSILILLGALYVTAMIILTFTILVTESVFFYDNLAFNCQLGIALMFGSVSVLGSPATVMAIKIELNSVGPFTSLMLGATMTAEFVVLVSFSISRIVCSIYCAELDVSLTNLAFTMSIVISNILVGVVLAGLTFAIFQIPRGERPEHLDDHGDADIDASPSATAYYNKTTHTNVSLINMKSPQHTNSAYAEGVGNEKRAAKSTSLLTPQTSLCLKGFIWLTMGYVFYISTNIIAKATDVAFGLSWEVKFEPLLVLMVAACIAGHHVGVRHDMHVILDTTAPYIFLAFFVMTGAGLKLDQVVHAIPLMTMYVVLRYVAIFIACYVGGRCLLKLPPRQYNNLWLTMTPQAGVALGLANEVKALSDETWANDFAATIVAAVVVNQIIGPVLCAMGLSHAGETLKDRALDHQDTKDDADPKDVEYEGNEGDLKARQSCISIRASQTNGKSRFSILDTGDAKALLPFNKLNDAVVIGDDETAFEIALQLSLYGARVNVPLLDEKRTTKWRQMNDNILQRTAKGDLISYKNTLKDRDNAQAMSSADVIIFTGDVTRTRENVHMLKSLLGDSHPRMIVLVPDCKHSKEMKAQGALVIQPSIALANIATRMALLDPRSAEALSNEISTTSDFSTASYYLRDDRDVADMRMDGRHLALGRNVVNHHSVDYDRLAEALTTENLPLPPPPSRVSMFGTSSASGFDPFQHNKNESSFFVMHDESDDIEEAVRNGGLRHQSRCGVSIIRPSVGGV
ncbi:unnamed protein product [Peronospora destructor]|uniref:Cation/H+ exchanger transmembrane domain-containing protein n=1 Tax=Peronospora destructor TaxID=86335 RepID=A0AAV0TH38_9STRA|nr:unnamed protein product [Peronospora destructor]